MNITINSNIYQQAQAYAQQHGLNLSNIIENFLLRIIGQDKANTEQPIPDVVLSLLGAGESISADDLNGREAYYHYLEEKYQ